MISDIYKNVAENWRDILNITGFFLVVWTLISARTAAKAAKDAVNELKKRQSKFDATSILTSVVVKIGQIRDLQRDGFWNKVPTLYSDVRSLLAQMEGTHTTVTGPYQEHLQNAVVDFARIMEDIEKKLEAGGKPENMAEINQTISKHEERFTTLLTILRQQE